MLLPFHRTNLKNDEVILLYINYTKTDIHDYSGWCDCDCCSCVFQLHFTELIILRSAGLTI